MYFYKIISKLTGIPDDVVGDMYYNKKLPPKYILHKTLLNIHYKAVVSLAHGRPFVMNCKLSGALVMNCNENPNGIITNNNIINN